MRPLLLFFIPLLTFGQPSDSLFHKTRALSGKLFVSSVIKDFYQIYSLNFDSAILFTNEAKELAISNGWHKEAAYASMCGGIANYLRGDYKKALPEFLYAARTFDSLQLDSGIARVHNEMAVFYHKNKEVNKAFRALEISEAAALRAGDIEALGTSYGNHAAFLSRQGRWEEAYPYVLKTLDIRLEQNDSVGLGYIYLDLAEHEMQKGDFEKAQKYVSQSTEIRQLIGDRQGVAVNTVINGENYFAIGEFKKAIPYFLRTIELAKPIGFTDLIRFSYDMLQQAYINIGDYEKAYEYLQQNRIFNDSIFNIEQSKTLLDLETRYETEKKEQQIVLQEAQLDEQKAILERNRIGLIASFVAFLLVMIIGLLWKNRIQKKQELMINEERLNAREAEIKATIASQEKERSRYARDLHDGFGQMISVLNMNLENLQEDAKPDERQRVYNASSKVINEMYDELKNICFDLMPQTLVKHGIKSGLQEFVSRVNSTNKIFIELNVFGIEERLSDTLEISLFRIAQEWINNILKYSDASNVTLQLTSDDKEITLLIEDNGRGFNKMLLIDSKGNGWKNLNTRTNLISGHLEVETNPGVIGNTLILNAPLTLREVHSLENTLKTV